jgi:predicted PurR-regulated permease PerM
VTSDGSTGRPADDGLRVRLTAGSTLLVIGAVVTAGVVIALFQAAKRPLAWVVAASVVAWLLSWVIALLDRWLPHLVSILISVIGFVVVIGGAWVGVSATLVAEVDKLRAALPQAAMELEARYEAAADFRLVERAQAFVNQLDERFGTQAEVAHAAGTASTYVVTGVLMLFLVGYGPRFVAAGLRQIADPARRAMATAVLDRASRTGRAYLLILVAQITVITAVCSLVFYLLDLPAPFVLGLLVGLTGAIPYFGILLGGLAPLLAAATNARLSVYVVLVALLVGLQLVEVLVVRPRVDRDTLRVGPAVILIGALVGYQLYGFGGAIYGPAALVFVWAILRALPDRNAAAEPVPTGHK